MIKKQLLFVYFILIGGVANAQNVGIGTLTPKAKLEVQYPGRSDLKISSSNYLDTTQLIFSNRTMSNEGTDFIISSNRESGLWFSSTSDLLNNIYDSCLIITPQGMIGISNPTPAERLDVRGNINFTGALKVNGSSGNLGQVLTSNGISSPTWQNTGTPQIGFAAIGTAPAISNYQLITNNTDTKVTIFNVEQRDDGNIYDPVTARATAPSAGMYHIDASVNYSLAEAGPYELRLHLINDAGVDAGATRLMQYTVAPGLVDQNIRLSISADLYLLTNQSIEVYTYQASGVQQRITGSFFSWFNMHKVY